MNKQINCQVDVLSVNSCINLQILLHKKIGKVTFYDEHNWNFIYDYVVS